MHYVEHGFTICKVKKKYSVVCIYERNNNLKITISDVVSISCFGVRVSVMFHFMFVHYTFSSVWVAEWPPFGK